jgi:hypothetical protein
VVAVLFLKRATVRHQGRSGKRSLNMKGTKDSLNSEKSEIDYNDQEARRKAIERKRRWEGYEWLIQ